MKSFDRPTIEELDALHTCVEIVQEHSADLMDDGSLAAAHLKTAFAYIIRQYDNPANLPVPASRRIAGEGAE